MSSTDEGREKPVVEVADSRYQPTKAEMEEDIVIDASPEELFRAVVHNVEIRISVAETRARSREISSGQYRN